MKARDLIAAAAAFGATTAFGQTLSTAVTYAVGDAPRELVVADFDGDGVLDLAVGNSGGGTGGNSVSVLIGNGDGTFQAQTQYPAGALPTSMATGDYDSDGDADFSVSNGNDVNIEVFYNDGSGNFSSSSIYQFDPFFWGVIIAHRAADMNGDGDIDLVGALLTENGIVMLPNDGSGVFTTEEIIVNPTPDFPVDVRVSDLNTDGVLDVVYYFQPFVPGNICWASLGDGNGGFGLPVETITNSSTGIINTPTDFDGDTFPDIVYYLTANPGGSIQVMLGNGDGSFAVPPGFTDTYAIDRPSQVDAADFNGDGRADLVISSYSPFNAVTLMLGNGDGTFGVPEVFPAMGTNPEGITVADLNADGALDVITANRLTDNISVLLGVPQVVCLADTNEDGVLSPADFSAWIAQFNVGGPLCDQNGDGMCTPADFSAWIANFNAGC